MLTTEPELKKAQEPCVSQCIWVKSEGQQLVFALEHPVFLSTSKSWSSKYPALTKRFIHSPCYLRRDEWNPRIYRSPPNLSFHIKERTGSCRHNNYHPVKQSMAGDLSSSESPIAPSKTTHGLEVWLKW
jgi:hypothetical protein